MTVSPISWVNLPASRDQYLGLWKRLLKWNYPQPSPACYIARESLWVSSKEDLVIALPLLNNKMQEHLKQVPGTLCTSDCPALSLQHRPSASPLPRTFQLCLRHGFSCFPTSETCPHPSPVFPPGFSFKAVCSKVSLAVYSNSSYNHYILRILSLCLTLYILFSSTICLFNWEYL